MSVTARSLDEQWMQCKDALREALDPDEALAWLPGLQLAHLSPERAVLAGVPNAFFQQRILRQFTPLLRRSLAGAFADWALRPDFQLDLRIGTEGTAREREAHRADPADRAGTARPDLASAHLAGQLSLFPEDPSEAPEGAGLSEASGTEGTRGPAGAEMLGFAAFQVGAENRVAALLAREVGEQPGRHNPFFLAGPAGAGKSHLLGAIAAAWAARHPDWRIVRRGAEQFTVEVLDGIRRKRMPAVRETYRGADALLLDDLGFLEVSAKAQEELLHTFETLYGAGKPIALAADRVPSALRGLSEPLRSRLEAALVAEVGLPGYETRRAILRAGSTRAGLKLGEVELQFLAERVTGNARKLEGVLARLTAQASLLRRAPDAALVRELAAPWLDPEPVLEMLLAPGAVLEAVCAEFGLTLRQLRSRERSRQRDLARQMAMRLLRERSGLASAEIGRWLGNRAHSTVVEAIAALGRKLERDARLRDTFTQLQRKIDGTPGQR